MKKPLLNGDCVSPLSFRTGVGFTAGFVGLHLSPKSARISFWILFLLGILTRFWNLNRFQGQYGLDQVMVFKHVENILSGHYRLLEDFGSRPPLSRFAVAFLCKCLPSLEITTALRATSAFFDSIALAVFYWFGKAWGNRRTGLILMGLGLISRPMIYKAYWGIDYNLLSILIPLALGASRWALEKPTFLRFLFWGSAVSFGIYAVTAYRPWIPILVSGTGWALWGRMKAKKETGSIGFFYVFALTALWFFVFCLSHNFIFHRSVLSPAGSKTMFILVIVGLSLWTLAWFKKRIPQTSLGAWGTGSLLALGLYGIIAADPIFSPHVEILAFWKTKVFQADPWGISAIRFNYLWDFLALKGGDYINISDPGQPFFDLATGLTVLLGLTRILGKPTWGGLALGFFGFLGLSVFLTSFSPHSGRLYGCLFPFYALAAFALEDIWNRLRQGLPDRWMQHGVLLIVLVVSASALVANFSDVWNWMDRENVESIMARAAREAPSTSQIYLVASTSLQQEAVDQLKGKRSTAWWNPPYEKPKALGSSQPEMRFLVPVENKEALSALKRLYPSAIWMGRASQKGDPEIKVWEVTIAEPLPWKDHPVKA